MTIGDGVIHLMAFHTSESYSLALDKAAAEFFFLGPYSKSAPAHHTLYQEIFIAWQHPPDSTFKLNTDSASFGNPGPAGAGGVFRDQWGDWVFGFSTTVGFATNSLAEA
ncbi:hypothetical protein ACH5RR_038623 [Cinchona calisaya]|uniref:RNase H type-1 domain-containing protein n=1 Tax=Cinchona calisaya TaxID=153742 RepID=A0ABD2XZX6_9GENT